jgi:hypothetical protein
MAARAAAHHILPMNRSPEQIRRESETLLDYARRLRKAAKVEKLRSARVREFAKRAAPSAAEHRAESDEAGEQQRVGQ